MSARRGFGLTHCQSHNDPGPSLSITVKNDRVLKHCFGGCSWSTLRAGLESKGLSV